VNMRMHHRKSALGMHLVAADTMGFLSVSVRAEVMLPPGSF